MDYSKEEWRPVVNYEGYYEVSNMGRVRNIARVDSNNHFKRSRILKTYSKARYESLYLSVDGTKERKSVHRLVAESFLGISEKQFVNHKDGNKHNNCLSNLECVTPSENNNHAYRNGLCSRSKRIEIYSKNNGTITKHYSAREAARFYGKGSAYFSGMINYHNGENCSFKARYI